MKSSTSAAIGACGLAQADARQGPCGSGGSHRLDILEKDGRALGPSGRAAGHRQRQLAAGRAGRKQRCVRCSCCSDLGGCTDLRVAHHVRIGGAHRVAAGLPFPARTAGGPTPAHRPARATMDAAVRAAIAAPAGPGLHAGPAEDTRVLGIDYTLSDAAARTRGGWTRLPTTAAAGAVVVRTTAPARWTTHCRCRLLPRAHAHRAAVPVLDRHAGLGRHARQSFPAELPQGARLQAALDRMMRKLLVQLPRRAEARDPSKR